VNRILFVDDEPRVLAGLRRMLRCRHDVWNMRFVESAAAALQALEAEPADLIVTDFRMPGTDGGQLLAEVRRRYPDTARFILSGHTAENDLMRVVTIAHQFLAKPCEPGELVAAVERALRLRLELRGEHLQAELSCISALPSPPSSLHALLEILESPDSNACTVARVLEGDVALGAKVLQLVNSSFFAPRSRTTSLEEAVVRLGIQTIRSLVLMDEMGRAFQIPEGVPSDWLERLNAQALETAQLARRLAAPEARNDAFCAGLLHECGQLVFAVCRPAVFATLLNIRERDSRPLADIERETFGVTHAEVGAYLLSLWGFPLEIVEAAAHHHSGPAELKSSGGLGALGAVRLAHVLVESERISLCTAPGEPASDPALESPEVRHQVQAWRAESPQEAVS
jgi:HD-like signal output (HDOD) protein/CheY-like chemotaxis protein